MRPTILLFLLVASMSGATAGCLGQTEGGTGAADATTTAGPPAFAQTLALTDCIVHEGRFVVPAPLVADDVPEGFSAVSPDGSGQTAWLGMLAFSCANATAPASGIEAAPYTELRSFVVVEPPEAYRNASVDEYHVQFVNYVSDDRVVPLYESWGHWAWTADVRIDETSVAAGRVGIAAADDGDEPWELHTLVADASESCGDGFTIGVFGWYQDALVGRVDAMLSDGCRTSGPAKGLLPDALGGEPQDAVLVSIVNALLTGSGAQYGQGAALTQRFVALSA